MVVVAARRFASSEPRLRAAEPPAAGIHLETARSGTAVARLRRSPDSADDQRDGDRDEPRHLGLTATVTRSPAPPARRHEQPIVERHQKPDVDRARAVEETVDVGVVERLDADDVRAWREDPRSGTRRRVFSVNAAISAPVAGLNATTCAPSTPVPLRVTRPRATPGALAELRRGIQVGDAGNVVGLQLAVLRDAAPEGDREHHGRRSEDAAAAVGTHLGFADRRVAEADEVADLMKRHRLEVESSRDRPARLWTRETPS